MNYKTLDELDKKIYFTLDEVAELLKLSSASARVYCTRYVKSGYFIRVKRNLYITKNRHNNLTGKDLYRLANVIQVPSYVSLGTALGYYGVTTQIQQGLVESVAVKRSIKYEVVAAEFRYTMIKKDIYFGFEKKGGFFVANKEKAFLDVLYLSSFGKYKFDFSAVDYGKLDKKRIKKLIKRYPEKTKNYLDKIWKI